MRNNLFPLLVAISVAGNLFGFIQNASAQTPKSYRAPQDTVLVKRAPNESLTTIKNSKVALQSDTRLIGAAVKAAELLSDTTKFDNTKGISVDQLFTKPDLQYFADQGMNTIIALFEQVNKYLPKGYSILFRTEQNQNVQIGENPLVLKDLRAIISDKPANFRSDHPQWQENVYHAYMARDYGTKLHNTITITSATREIRETPELELINTDGSPISLNQILAKHTRNTANKYQAEKQAVAEFRSLTFPGNTISKESANENYRRALFALMRLQEGDINRHPETKQFVTRLTADLRKGSRSNVLTALKNSSFFDANVPGNLGPVLLTETQVIDPAQVESNAEAKAMELIMLTALHYGERDAVKLLKRMENGTGAVAATKTGDFTPKRLGQLTDHGTEKLKSLGFGADKTTGITSADLVLLAVAAPENPVKVNTSAFLRIQKVGESIINQYSTVEIKDTKNLVMLNPRAIFRSRHTEYRAAYDAVDFVPELRNGVSTDQDGSRVTQNGVELRLESDIYFSNPYKIIEKGRKPFVYPEFGIIAGTGTRSVGYDDNTTLGEHGAVPRFRQRYVNWGGHLGLNAGPVLLAVDATVLSTEGDEDPYKRFFDLSQAMTYFRYSLTARILNLGLRKPENGSNRSFTLDLELAGETNNEGTINKTRTQSGASQTGSAEWERDYQRAHPGGVYNHAIATEMILNGDVKAAYAASSYANLVLGYQQSNFHLQGNVGLYNLKAIAGHDVGAGEWAESLFQNTIKGNLFVGLSLTYNFSSRSFRETRKRTTTYQTGPGNESTNPKIEESSSESKSKFSPRNMVIFTNQHSQ